MATHTHIHAREYFKHVLYPLSVMQVLVVRQGLPSAHLKGFLSFLQFHHYPYHSPAERYQKCKKHAIVIIIIIIIFQ